MKYTITMVAVLLALGTTVVNADEKEVPHPQSTRPDKSREAEMVMLDVNGYDYNILGLGVGIEEGKSSSTDTLVELWESFNLRDYLVAKLSTMVETDSPTKEATDMSMAEAIDHEAPSLLDDIIDLAEDELWGPYTPQKMEELCNSENDSLFQKAKALVQIEDVLTIEDGEEEVYNGFKIKGRTIHSIHSVASTAYNLNVNGFEYEFAVMGDSETKADPSPKDWIKIK